MRSPKKIILCLALFFGILAANLGVIFIGVQVAKKQYEDAAIKRADEAADRYEKERAQNCDWLKLFSMLIDEKTAKALVNRGLKPCEMVSIPNINFISKDDKFSFFDNLPVIESYYFSEYENALLKIQDNLFAGVARQIKLPFIKSNNSTKYEFAGPNPTILLIDSDKGEPKILKKYDTKAPYCFALKRDKWLVFNSNLTACEIVELKNNNGDYDFTRQPCVFDNRGDLLWE